MAVILPMIADLVGDQRVDPAQRADDVHPGSAPRPGDQREGDRRRDRRHRVDVRSPWPSARSATSSAPPSRAPIRSGMPRRVELALHRHRQRARADGRLHARRPVPQLGRRHRRRTSSTRCVLPTLAEVLAAAQEWFTRPAAVGRLQLRPGCACSTATSAASSGANLATSGFDLAGRSAGRRPEPGDAVRGQVGASNPQSGRLTNQGANGPRAMMRVARSGVTSDYLTRSLTTWSSPPYLMPTFHRARAAMSSVMLIRMRPPVLAYALDPRSPFKRDSRPRCGEEVARPMSQTWPPGCSSGPR